MLARIQLHALAFYAYHGVLPEESRLGQRFLLDLSFEVDIAPAAAADDLTQTVNYAEVYALCASIITTERFALIEALAQRLLGAVLAAQPRIQTLTLTLHKPDAPIPGQHRGVSITVSQSRHLLAVPSAN
jgi:7,8-dihydroneopterin aldolase/epimerase/oxygenase